MSIRFEVLSAGNVVQSPVGTSSSVVTVGSRCAVARDGGVVCTYMAQSKLGINDFVPMICRSDMSGRSWTRATPLWPDLSNRYSIFCNLSRSPASAGAMFVFGTRTPIETPGESVWCEETKGLKANDLIWACSHDDGRTWSQPHAFPLPYPGSAEAPGPLVVTRHGRWIAPYSPYNLFDASIRVDCSRVIAVRSDDGGDTWKPSVMIQFDESQTGGAEAWVAELNDGSLLGATWQVDMSGRQIAYPNRYAISRDGGDTWSPTRSTGIIANTTALTPLSEGRALFVTVRRRTDAGIWLSVVQPTEEDFGVLVDQRVWSCASATQSGGQARHDSWTDFSFGEPCVALLPDGTLFMVFWCLDQANAGIHYITLRMIE